MTPDELAAGAAAIAAIILKASTCRQCGKYPIKRPRGLCWTCHDLDQVVDLDQVDQLEEKGVGLDIP